MARYLEKNYVLNVAAKTITFSDYQTIKLDDILLIINLKLNTQIYNVADGNLRGTVATNVLTFIAPTTGMVNSDKLQIWLHINNFNTVADDVGGGVTYFGKSVPGVLITQPYWAISRLTETGDDLETHQADGNADFDNIWNNRLSLSYS